MYDAAGNMAVTEEQLVASICRESFYEFLKEFWSTIIPEEPEWNWHIEYLCNEFQTAAECVFRGEAKAYDEIVNVPPGTTKSTIFSVCSLPWCWTRMPTLKMICGSYAYPLALELSRKSRMVLQSEKYRKCFPEVVLSDDQNTKGHFVNTLGGMRYAVGVCGSVTGMHAHIITIDDPLDPNGALSEEEIKSSNHWMTETLPSRKVDKRVTVTFLIMQRLHQNDPTGFMLDKKRRKANLRHICLPAELATNINPPELAARYVDGLLDPVRLNHDVLEEANEDLLDEGYSCQYGQDPVPRGGGMFKVDRLVLSTDPPPKMRRVVRYWDKAGTGGGGAFTVGTKMGMGADGRVYVLDVKRGQWDADRRERIIVETAYIDSKKVRPRVEQEPGSGGKESAEMTIRNLAGFNASIDIPHGKKELRADPFAAQMNAGNVVVPANAPWLFEWMKEHRFFPRSRYKDQVDSAAGAYAAIAKPRRIVGALPLGRAPLCTIVALAAACITGAACVAAAYRLLD